MHSVLQISLPRWRLLEVNNGNLETTCEIGPKLTTKTFKIFHNLLKCLYSWLEKVDNRLVLRARVSNKPKAFFSFIKVKCEFWTPHTCNMGDFVKTFDSLNPLKMFTGSSILGVWKDPETVSGSVYVFLEIIDYSWFTFICSYCFDWINVDVVRKCCVHLILICTFSPVCRLKNLT